MKFQLWLSVIFIFCAIAVKAAPRAALMNFTCQVESYRDIQAASDFSAALQAVVSSRSSVDWVERNQWKSAAQELKLNLFNGGMRDGLRLGKWVKADLLVVGEFQVGQKQDWELKIEVIDLDHADVLWWRK
jgi:hypothetical protein